MIAFSNNSKETSHRLSSGPFWETHSTSLPTAAADNAYAKRVASPLLRLAPIGLLVVPLVSTRTIRLRRHRALLLATFHTWLFVVRLACRSSTIPFHSSAYGCTSVLPTAFSWQSNLPHLQSLIEQHYLTYQGCRHPSIYPPQRLANRQWFSQHYLTQHLAKTIWRLPC